MSEEIRHIIEAGPPTTMVANFEQLFRSKITTTKLVATESRIALRWPVTSGGLAEDLTQTTVDRAALS